MKISRILFALVLISLYFHTHAQDQKLHQLYVRMNALERKVSMQDSLYKKLLNNNLPNSRNEVENNSYSGFVISSIKGVLLSIGGFIETDLIHDLNPLGDKYSFTTSSIEMNPDPGSQNVTNFSVRPSRISFKGSNTNDSFSALLEFDFAGSNGTTAPRLRHAYITYKNWSAGKYWSNFMDNNNNPDILDFEGPNATISIRQIQVRYSIAIGKSNKMAFSLEMPGSEVTLPATWSSKNVFPDFTVSFEHQFWQGTSHLRLAALIHPITYLNASVVQKNNLGGAMNFTGSVQVTKLDNINFQATAGTGFGKYNNDLGGLGYDAFQSKVDTSKLSTANQLNLFFYYNHWWTARLSSALGGGYVGLLDKCDSPASDIIKSTSYASTNFIYYPNDHFKFGLEVLYGKRKDMDNKTMETIRFQFTFFAKI
ncbi:MAG: DcaP family trimeric outer membrane transporter [Bacteroidota bacterium]